MDATKYSKAQRKTLRALVAQAHKRELERELGRLEADFRAWREGRIDAFELNDRIHKFHDGASRELWKTYVQLGPEFVVPPAIARGVIEEGEVPPDLLESMRTIIEACRPGGPPERP